MGKKYKHGAYGTIVKEGVIAFPAINNDVVFLVDENGNGTIEGATLLVDENGNGTIPGMSITVNAAGNGILSY